MNRNRLYFPNQRKRLFSLQNPINRNAIDTHLFSNLGDLVSLCLESNDLPIRDRLRTTFVNAPRRPRDGSGTQRPGSGIDTPLR